MRCKRIVAADAIHRLDDHGVRTSCPKRISCRVEPVFVVEPMPHVALSLIAPNAKEVQPMQAKCEIHHVRLKPCDL
jgi:hypothetical protein